MYKKPYVLIAVFLFIAWFIGSGFYGLPISSGTSGFLPSITINILVALYAIPSALLYTEAIVNLPDGANIITLCKKYIGPTITVIVAALFFYLHYYYLSSYFLDLPPFIQSLFQNTLSITSIRLLLFLLLCLIVYLGIYTTSYLSFILNCALLVAFAWFFLLHTNHISTDLLLRTNWTFVFLAIPTYVGNHYLASLLPTVSTYLKQDVKKLCTVIFASAIACLLISLFWQFLALSTTSESDLWIANGGFLKSVQNIDLPQPTATLTYILHSMFFFSIFTTLLIAGYILVDACFDGFRTPPEKRIGYKRILIIVLVFLPPLLLSYTPWIPVIDDFTGWGEIFMIGPLPIWLVWNLRYKLNSTHHQLLPGGKSSLIIYAIISFILLYVQTANFLWNNAATQSF